MITAVAGMQERLELIVLPEALEEIGALKPEFTNDWDWFIFYFLERLLLEPKIYKYVC